MSFFVFILVPASKILVAVMFIGTVIIIVNVTVTRDFIATLIIKILLVMLSLLLLTFLVKL